MLNPQAEEHCADYASVGPESPPEDLCTSRRHIYLHHVLTTPKQWPGYDDWSDTMRIGVEDMTGYRQQYTLAALAYAVAVCVQNFLRVSSLSVKASFTHIHATGQVGRYRDV